MYGCECEGEKDECEIFFNTFFFVCVVNMEYMCVYIFFMIGNKALLLKANIM